MLGDETKIINCINNLESEWTATDSIPSGKYILFMPTLLSTNLFSDLHMTASFTFNWLFKIYSVPI